MTNTSFNPINGAIGITNNLLGKNQVDEATKQYRLNICRNCEESTKNPKYLDHECKGLTKFSMCKKCFCPICAKTKLTYEKCPIDKWPAVIPESGLSQ